MKISELFDFLVKDYNLSYKYQEFENCYGCWSVRTHSFYNDSGCFTIEFVIQREMNFCCSSQFSTVHKELCERDVDVTLIEPQVWEKHEKIWIFKRPFFWWSEEKVLKALAEALEVHLGKGNDFFGIPVKRD